ncbi:phosphoadenylyl-sulfate reductase [Mucisphaera calidilacus]|uniref:Phosphoadenosine 5'-phosphosulfate reductase n=1 Tax=Mucisphaera calidilacus TaxID=2527982 RepID=A0A518BYV7_9BACT|nr:phosphoadenylyl-sulfate reductase [Mucisphaera calidilacus]QDU72159.1 Phosphoadenosine phosphosulfate reductase [Mucisphaera calidilacus]
MSMTKTQGEASLDVAAANDHLEALDAQEVVRWAHETFGEGLILSSSFGAQSAVMLHLVTRVVPGIPVVWIDTGYLFPETYKFAAALEERLGLNLRVYQPEVTPARFEALHGRVWESGGEGLDAYHRVFKVEPMQRALRELGATAWFAGLRAEQSASRSSLGTLGEQDGVYKVHPILKWSTRQVHAYLKEHDLPYHPLVDQGYASIGDVHSTRPITAGEDERAGRFGGLKQECGIHLPSSAEESASRDASGL